jgi:hypothetical protein
MQVGQKLSFSVDLFDKSGAVNPNIPGVGKTWSVYSGSGVNLMAPTSGVQTVVVEATAPGTAVILFSAVQTQETEVVTIERMMTITVVSPGATATPVPPISNPGTPPASIPGAQGVLAPASPLLITSTGVESGGSAENRAFGDRPALFIRSGSVNNFYGVNVASVDPTTLPELPARFRRGSSAARITFTDVGGTPMENTRLLRSARVCLNASSSDISDGFSNARLLRYNSAVSQWVELSSTYNTITRQVCGSSSNFSDFAIGVLQVQATTDPNTGGLPATGGWSPNAGMLIFVGLLGFVLLGGGAVSMRRARGVRSE